MAEWITELGQVLEELFPSWFRRTNEGHWSVNFDGNWQVLPDHCYLGGGLAIIGSIAFIKSKSAAGKIISFVIAGFGVYLIYDDFPDLKRHLSLLMDKIKALLSPSNPLLQD